MKNILIIASLLFTISTSAKDLSLQAGLDEFKTKVQPLLTKYCQDCHGPKKEKGDVRIDTLNPDIINGKHGETWEEILELMNTAEMPPEDEAQPTPEEREILTKWLNTEFKKAIAVKSSAKPKANIRRMTRYELNYAIEDLLRIEPDQSSPLPEEVISHHTGLKNSSELLVTGINQLESYMDTVNNSIDIVDQFVSKDKPRIITGMPHILKELKTKKSSTFPKEKPKRKAKSEICQNLKPSFRGVLMDKNGKITFTLENPPTIGKYRLTFTAKVSQKAETLSFYSGYRRSVNPAIKELEETVEVNSKQIKTYTISGNMNDLKLLGADQPAPLVIWLMNNGGTANNIYIESCDFAVQEHTEVKQTTNLNASGPTINPRDAIRRFAQMAFRRPLASEELNNYENLYKKLTARRMNKASAMIKTYSYILSSPKFFFLGAKENNDADFQLAESLSFFLWSSVPDTELLALAYKKELGKPEVLRSQIRRMLKDERSKRLIENFSDQWLQTDQMFNVAVDVDIYKKFNQGLYMPLLRQEVIESVNDVFRNGQSALNLIKSDYAYVNETLAKHYDIPGVKGNEFRKVKLPANSSRGGLLTQGAFLITNSDGASSHVVKRGVWLIERILNDPPPPPPKTVPDFDDSIPGFDKFTLSKKLAIHRDNDACRNCHKKIDPWGLVFENFDASGAWREKVTVKAGDKKNKAIYAPIESTATIPGGITLKNTNQLKDYIIKEKSEQFARGLTEKLLSYAIWRDVAFYDRELVQELNQKFVKSGYNVGTLIEEIALSKKFQRR
ncbi:MAG: DUF1592 domain-containing protein [Lentisphaeraceae bacterium]|nr:DUF1592 domain-containing protein [Lentisphaeraceae bacterium]